MLPLRAIAEEFGTTVDWIASTRTVTLVRGSISVSLSVDRALPDGMGMPRIVNDRTMVPIRYIAETLGAHVEWNERESAVIVTESTQNITPTQVRQTPTVTSTPARQTPTITPTPVQQTPTATRTPTTLPPITSPQTPSPQPSLSLEEFEQRVFELTNAERANYGLPPLIWDSALAAAARAHSDDLDRNNIFSHTGSDGSSVGQRLSSAGISHRGWAENINRGRNTPEGTVASWMASAGHRSNILNRNMTHLGVGHNRNRVITTQKFIVSTSTQQPLSTPTIQTLTITPTPAGQTPTITLPRTPTITPPHTPTITPPYTPTATPGSQGPSSINVSDFERRVFELTNAERANHGLPPLIWDSALADLARAHSIDIARNNIFGHVSSDGTTFGGRLTRAGIPHRGAAENVGGRNTPEATVAGWMNSPGHRANILNGNMTHLGVGFYHFEGSQRRFYATQKFARFE